MTKFIKQPILAANYQASKRKQRQPTKKEERDFVKNLREDQKRYDIIYDREPFKDNISWNNMEYRGFPARYTCWQLLKIKLLGKFPKESSHFPHIEEQKMWWRNFHRK